MKAFPIPLALLITFGAQAQQDPPFNCAANDLSLSAPPGGYTAEQLARFEAADAELEEFTRRFAETYTPEERNPYIIPVVFHIIHNNGPENISDAQVHDAMRVLNDDFNKRNTDWPTVRLDFRDIVADVGVEFRLARKDPNGNCTRGIVRVQSTLTNNGQGPMRDLSRWPRDRYLNIWVAAYAGSDGVAGYTYRPANATTSNDGIVMVHSYVGSIGTGSTGRSRTLTHEVGHWINLAHTWGNSNTPGEATNCNGDDGVADTPNTIGWRTCNTGGVSCNSLDNVENYMEYSYCFKMFTNGQKTRMIAALNSSTASRNNLWKPTNLALTGLDGTPLLCAAEFNSNMRTICAGGSVTFSDDSYHDPTSRTWSFPGGTPSTSTDANPTVTYAQPGTYSVTLTVSDGTSTLNATTPAYITVLANPGAPVPFSEGFEGYPNIGSSPWAVVNPDNNNTFAITNAAAFSGSNSVRVLNTSAMSGQVDELVSGSFDMSNATSVRITFRYAFAQRATGNDDRLRVHVSNNCGATWSLRQQLRGTLTLNTAGGPVTSSFVPTASQWNLAEIANVSNAFHVSDFRVRFEFESNGGNNLYIDDININGAPVGIDGPVRGGGSALVVVPNPSEDGRAQAVFTLAEAGQARMELLDVLGRRLMLVHEGNLPAGPQRMDLPVAGLQAGLYFVRLQQGARNEAVRFVVK